MLKERKKILILAIILFFIGNSNVMAQLKNKSIEYAAIVATKSAIKEIKDKNINNIADDSKKEILSKIHSHKERKESEKLIRAFISVKLKSEFNEDLRKIHKSFNVQLSEDQFKREIEKKFGSDIENNKNEFLKNKGSKVFINARDLAINEQMSRVSLKVYPSESEVEEIDKAGWKSSNVRNMKEKLKRAMRKSEEKLLEEVENKIDKRVEDISEDIKQQIKVQKNALGLLPPGNLFTIKQFRDAWEDNVRKEIEKIKKNKEPWQNIYNIFLSIKEEINHKAGIEEQKRFREFIKNVNINIATEEEISKVIREDIKAHKAVDNSLNLITKKIMDKAIQKIIEKYALNAQPGERSDFTSRLQNKYLPNVKAEIRERVDALLMPDLNATREKIAKEQVKGFFPVLADGSWELSGKNEEIIKRIKINKNLSIRSYDDCMKEPVLTSITERNVKKDELLNETEEKVFNNVNMFLSEAEKAWDGQWDIYLTHKSYIEDVADKGKKILIEQEIKNKPGRDKAYWVEYFTSEINKIWQKNRVSLIWPQGKPKYQKEKYVELLKYVKDEIEQRMNTDVAKTLDRVKNKNIVKPADVATGEANGRKIEGVVSVEEGVKIGSGAGDVKNGGAVGKEGNKTAPPPPPFALWKLLVNIAIVLVLILLLILLVSNAKMLLSNITKIIKKFQRGATEPTGSRKVVKSLSFLFRFLLFILVIETAFILYLYMLYVIPYGNQEIIFIENESHDDRYIFKLNGNKFEVVTKKIPPELRLIEK
ncbi:hypothetical protein HY990_00070 [Candidatus Micrarchaeota archaeon]|nr:hypothetical protein [Candidatus Micrarchaeota archaeon]